MELIKEEGKSKKGCTLCGNNLQRNKVHEMVHYISDIVGGTEVCPKIAFHIRKTIQHKDMGIKWLDFILLLKKLNPVFELGKESVFRQ